MDQQLKNTLFSRIETVAFPENQYYKEAFEKRQIALHHTVSPQSSVRGDLDHWLGTSARIATCVIIGDDKIHQLFSSRYWGHHLGIRSTVFRNRCMTNKNRLLNQQSIGVEIDALGPVDQDGFSIAYGRSLRAKNIVEYADEYRGYQFYEKYSDRQLDNLRLLLKYWCEVYDIDKTYMEDMWDVSIRALDGTSGIWSHTSYRADKSDVHPQPELIQVLKSL